MAYIAPQDPAADAAQDRQAPAAQDRQAPAATDRQAPAAPAAPATPATIARAFAALGDPTRRAIFERVAERPAAVGEIAVALPVSRPAVSQHLKVLRQSGLLTCRANGNRNIYSLDPQGVGALRVYLERFWTRSLAAFKAAAEQPAKEE
jgi:DNA-binding transcriptional ArsR family regulator